MDRARCATTPRNSPSSSDCPSRASSRSAFSWAAQTQTAPPTCDAIRARRCPPTRAVLRHPTHRVARGVRSSLQRLPVHLRHVQDLLGGVGARASAAPTWTVARTSAKPWRSAASSWVNEPPQVQAMLHQTDAQVRTRRYSNPNLLIHRSIRGVHDGPRWSLSGVGSCVMILVDRLILDWVAVSVAVN
jgi:hypothetical protein